jgi:nucleoside-diphosphate-sugar epimerase
MKIILTGASGFLGQHILRYFITEDIVTVGRFEGNVKVHLDKEIPVLPVCDLVIHSAGKAHMVPKTPAEEQDFFDVNVTGTHNLLKGLEQSIALPKGFVLISSIAVYGQDTGRLINEAAPLLASDPYGKSKAEAERMVQSWCNRHQVPFAILRLPLIAGPNPPGNLKSMINGIKKGYYFNIGGSNARKSMVLAESIPPFILPALKAGGIYNLTDGEHPSFSELALHIANQLGKGKPKNMATSIARTLAMVGDVVGKRFPLNRKSYKKIINDLTFDDAKARRCFGWEAKSVKDHFKL